jgi:hypothetical protein
MFFLCRKIPYVSESQCFLEYDYTNFHVNNSIRSDGSTDGPAPASEQRDRSGSPQHKPLQGPPHVLILGMAGGTLHMAMLEQYPCAIVDSVEIEELFLKHREQFGIHGELCHAVRLSSSSSSSSQSATLSSSSSSVGSEAISMSVAGNTNLNAAEHAETKDVKSGPAWSLEAIQYPHDLLTKDMNPDDILSRDDIGDSYRSDVVNTDLICRSGFVIDDAFDFIEFSVSGQSIARLGQTNSDANHSSRVDIKLDYEAVQSSTMYDIVFVDVFDSRGWWGGEPDEGTSSMSNIDTLKSNTFLQKLRRMLSKDRPSAAVFFVHWDQNARGLFRSIVLAFGMEQVAVFVVTSNSFLVVAGKQLFHQVPRPPPGFSKIVDNETRKQQRSLKYEYGYNPCLYGSEATHVFAQHIEQFVRRIPRFSGYMATANLYSLDCELFKKLYYGTTSDE